MRAWVLGSMVLLGCGGAPARATAGDPLPPLTEPSPAPSYLYVGEVREVSDGMIDDDGVALVVRAGRPRGEDGEPWFDSLEALSEELLERSAPEPDADEALHLLAREVCERGDERIPRSLRVGAEVDVLGPSGWRSTAITGCTSYSWGHFPYFAFFLAGAPEGVVLAAIDGRPRGPGSYRALSSVLPSPPEDARASLRGELVRLGLTGAFVEARAEHVGAFELPDGRAMIHVALPDGWDEPGDAAGREVCAGPDATCVATAILALDASGTASLVDATSAAEVPGLEHPDEGAWSVLGVFRDGPAAGLVAAYHSLGGWEIIITRWRGDAMQRQLLHVMSSG